MSASTRTRKATPPHLDLLEAKPSKELLPLEVRAIGRYGILELMRLGAGLSYQEVGRRAGMVPMVRAMRLIRGEVRRPKQRDLERIREVLWEALPAVADEAPLRVIEEQEFGFLRHKAARPVYLTLEEAADLLKVNREKMRRLASDLPELRAIKVGSAIRIPLQAVEDYLLGPRRVAPSGNLMSRQQVAAFFRVDVEVIHYAIEQGRIIATQKAKHYPWRIPMSEVERISRSGITDLPRYKRWQPGWKRNHARRAPHR